MYRLVGSLNAVSKIGGIYKGLEKFVGSKKETYGLDYEWDSFVEHVKRCKLVFIGEIHSVGAIANFQSKLIQALTTPNLAEPTTRKLHVVMEHFSFEMQPLLDDFCCRSMTFADLVKEYRTIGTEGHVLDPYRDLLEFIQSNHPNVRLHAGFISKKYARQLLTEGEEATLQSAKIWLPSNFKRLEGTLFHYIYFESLLTGRDMHAVKATKPSDRFQKIFKAQLIKDVAMANRIRTLIQQEPPEDQFVVIAGNGHVQHYQGVPERVLDSLPHLIDKTCLVTCHGIESLNLLKTGTAKELVQLVGPVGSNPADFLFLFHDDVELYPNEFPTSRPKEETQTGHD